MCMLHIVLTSICRHFELALTQSEQSIRMDILRLLLFTQNVAYLHLYTQFYDGRLFAKDEHSIKWFILSPAYRPNRPLFFFCRQ